MGVRAGRAVVTAEQPSVEALPDWQRKFRDCAKMRDEAFAALERAEQERNEWRDKRHGADRPVRRALRGSGRDHATSETPPKPERRRPMLVEDSSTALPERG